MKKLDIGICALAAAVGLALFGAPQPASASGPLERLVQYIRHPTDPNVVVLRFGVASEGLLFSRDGGRSFQALCSSAIDAGLTRLSPLDAPNMAPAVMDAHGRLVVASTNAVWTDDGTGCNWTKLQAFEGKWVTALALDPADPRQVLALANSSSGEDEALEVRAELLRRELSGAWSVQGLLRAALPGRRTYAGQLAGAATPAGSVLYATMSYAAGSPEERTSVVASLDGGRTWQPRIEFPLSLSGPRLLAVDPQRPELLLASSRERNTQSLLVSTDSGRNFRAYAKAYETSGVAFAPDGRVFVADAGDSASQERTGGVLTASALGEPLLPIVQPPRANPAVDCVGFDPSAQALRICRFHRYGTLSTTTGEFAQLATLQGVKGLLTCQGRDIVAACEKQFNDGYSWCCTGHYPFTSFCGSYDVTRAGTRPVACGLSGRDADIEAGRGPLSGELGIDGLVAGPFGHAGRGTWRGEKGSPCQG